MQGHVQEWGVRISWLAAALAHTLSLLPLARLDRSLFRQVAACRRCCSTTSATASTGADAGVAAAATHDGHSINNEPSQLAPPLVMWMSPHSTAASPQHDATSDVK
jgi:hypothetical protein